MKTENKITLISIVLLVVVIILASFVGIYKLKDYRVKNVSPKFLLSMEFNHTRSLKMEVDSEDSSSLTSENFEKAKAIVVSKLGDMKVKQYILRQNSENGTIDIQIPENEDTEKIATILNSKGKFEVTDSETGEVLLNKSHVAKVSSATYQQTDNSVLVALRIELNKEGKKIFSDMSNKYVEDETESVNPETGEKNAKNVDIKIDDQTYLSYHFQKNLKAGLLKYLDEGEGIITIPLGLSKNQEDLKKYSESIGILKVLLDNKEMPITYTLTDQIESAEITNTNIFIYIGLAIFALLFIINIIKFKLKGLVMGLLQIGYVALLMLVLRYTNVFISIEGMIATAFIVVINFIFGCAMLKDLDKTKETYLKYLLNLIPLYVIAVVFTFGVIANLTSAGNILFWGLVIMFIYNILITKTVMKAINK